MGCRDRDWHDRPSAVACWSTGVILLGFVLLGWLLVQALSGWLVRLWG